MGRAVEHSTATAVTEPRLRKPLFVTAAALTAREVPEREWIVPGLIPARQVTLLYGDGGVGKSLLTLQLGMAMAAGRPWLGRPVRRAPVLFWTAEDDEAELHRRIVDAARVDGIDLARLDDLALRSFVDSDPEIARADGGGVLPTGRYDDLRDTVETVGPALVILDTLAEFFSVDEVIRAQAARSVRLLRHIAFEANCAFLVLAHPSIAGMASGQGSSGSTGWSNAVRSRLWLSRIVDKKGAEPDRNARSLRIMKANYAETGVALPLRFDRGAFVPVAENDAARATEHAAAEATFLRLLREFRAQGRRVRETTGHGYAPTEFAGSGRAEGQTREALRGAMERLFARGAIRVDEYGPPSKRRREIVEVAE